MDTLVSLGLVLLFLLDGLTVAVGASLLNANLARLLAVREERGVQVNRVLDLLQAPQILQASLNLTQLLTRFSMASLVLVLLASWQAEAGFSAWLAAGFLLLAAVVIFLVEWLVDLLVSRTPEHWALRLAPFARGLIVVFSPLLMIPLAFNRWKKDDQEPASTVTQDELKSMVDASHEGGQLEQEERQMIYSIFDLGDTLVREIMLPRIYITALEASVPLVEAVDALVASGHSRVPVYGETIDNILGLLYAKDLLRVWREGGQLSSLRSLLRPVYFVPEAKKVDELLAEMQAGRVHMAVVVDEYGGIAGLVTLEDIVEEIVGEIRDEYDQSEELPYTQLGEGEYLFQGRIDLGDFNELMGSHLLNDEAETLGGYIYSQIGRVPASGETLSVGDLLLTVEQVSGRRIRKVRAKIRRAEEETPAQESKQDDPKTDQ